MQSLLVHIVLFGPRGSCVSGRASEEVQSGNDTGGIDGYKPFSNFPSALEMHLQPIAFTMQEGCALFLLQL